MIFSRIDDMMYYGLHDKQEHQNPIVFEWLIISVGLPVLEKVFNLVFAQFDDFKAYHVEDLGLAGDNRNLNSTFEIC